jgi:TatD DNase family protein
MTRLAALDLHAHIDVTIDRNKLRELHAVMFAATRSLEEADRALERSDEQVVWGAGCHPGLVRAQKAFDSDEFTELLKRTAFASELGLDGESRVPLVDQRKTLAQALAVLRREPRIVSLHSYRATSELIAELAANPIRGAVLHWWLGDSLLTTTALQLGCYFSVNASSVRHAELLEQIPRERVLSETDHPFGDRWSPNPRQPGGVGAVEVALANIWNMTTEDVRRQIWRNLAELVSNVGCGSLLPRGVRSQIAALG